MATSSLTWLRAAAVAAALATHALAQTCYYPNGDAAPGTEKPCSSDKAGSACCPDTWECLGNGLCHNPNANLSGRYSCTDQSWKAPGCPSNLCTYGGTAAGGESITLCSNHHNSSCCNADAVHMNCCQESPEPRPFFRLPGGRPYATIGINQAINQPILNTITGLALFPSTATPPPTGQTPAPKITSSPNRVSTRVSVSSGRAGFVTMTVVVTLMPSSNPSGSGAGGSDLSSQIGLIIGCAVGIPLALAFLACIIWMLRKRRQNKAASYKNTSSPELQGSSLASPAGFAAGAAPADAQSKTEPYRNSRSGTTEIDSTPVGPCRPISHIPGHAELDSGTCFSSGHSSYGPDTAGLGGGSGDGRSMWGSPPPGYSAGMGGQQGAFRHDHPTTCELDGTSVLPVIDEKGGGAVGEGSGDQQQQQQQQQQEQQQQQQQHQQQPQDVYPTHWPPNATAELSAVKTPPPEDAEKQLG
ncbi:hypothetical protein ACEQ8H_004850 [Pleosporales sp. CAS-2024a]